MGAKSSLGPSGLCASKQERSEAIGEEEVEIDGCDCQNSCNVPRHERNYKIRKTAGRIEVGRLSEKGNALADEGEQRRRRSGEKKRYATKIIRSRTILLTSFAASPLESCSPAPPSTRAKATNLCWRDPRRGQSGEKCPPSLPIPVCAKTTKTEDEEVLESVLAASSVLIGDSSLCLNRLSGLQSCRWSSAQRRTEPQSCFKRPSTASSPRESSGETPRTPPSSGEVSSVIRVLVQFTFR